MAVNGAVLGSIRGVLMPATAQVNSRLASTYLPSISGNAAALTALAAAPQTIASPVGVTYRNVRPFSAPVAQAATFVGLIYLTILSFNITMAGHGMRLATGLNRKLKFTSYAMMRILVPMCFYVPIAVMFSLINIPFKLPFDGMGLGYGAGFMLWLCVTWLGMVVLGLGTEAFITLVGAPFIGFALLLWILVNVSVAALPLELQGESANHVSTPRRGGLCQRLPLDLAILPWIALMVKRIRLTKPLLTVGLYKYGHAMPFHNLKNACQSTWMRVSCTSSLTPFLLPDLLIIFNAGDKKDLFLYTGVLGAWIVLLVLTIPIWLWLERRRDERAAHSAAMAKEASHASTPKDEETLEANP